MAYKFIPYLAAAAIFVAASHSASAQFFNSRPYFPQQQVQPWTPPPQMPAYQPVQPYPVPQPQRQFWQQPIQAPQPVWVMPPNAFGSTIRP